VVKEVWETRATPKDIAQTAAKRENKEVTFMANTRKEEALEALAENPPLDRPLVCHAYHDAFWQQGCREQRELQD